MNIPFSQFDQWIDSLYAGQKKPSLSAISRGAGYSQARVSMQKARGYIGWSVVVSYSRFIGLNPVDQLRWFGVLDLLDDYVEPTESELVSQVHLVDLLAEARHRLGADPEPLRLGEEELGFARWFDSVVPRGEAKVIAEKVGVAADEVSRKTTQNTWSMIELHEVCRAGGLNFRMAMVASGHLWWEEVGFDPSQRDTVLAEASNALLFDYVRDSLGFMERQARIVGDTRRRRNSLG